MPRLADHLDTENGPSDEEGGKEAKRQKSEPTTPISTSSRLPHEYDEVMGITQVDPREAERFEEGLDSESTMMPLKNHKMLRRPDPTHVPCFSHGGCGSSSLRECIELLNQTRSNSPATLHSGVKTEKLSGPAAGYEPKCGRRTGYCQWTGFWFSVRRPTATKGRATVSKVKMSKKK